MRTNKTFSSDKAEGRWMHVKSILIVVVVGFIAYVFLPLKNREKDKHGLHDLPFTLVSVSTISVYCLFMKRNKQVIFNYADGKIEYSYSNFFRTDIRWSYSMTDLAYSLTTEASRSGSQDKLVVTSGDERLFTIREKRDYFPLEKLRAIGTEIREINN